MRTYLVLAAAEFRRYSTYRLAVVGGLFTNTVFGFIRISVLMAAIGTAGGTLAGYTVASASTYVWLGQAFLAPVAMYATSEIADRVKSGDIAVDLARPVDLHLSSWARDLGRAGFMLVARGLLPILIGALTIGLALPASATAYPLGLLSLLLGVSISFSLRYLVNLLAFWVLDLRGFAVLYTVLISLLSGFIIPIHLFPDWLRTVAVLTPAPALLQYPVDVVSGRVLGGAALAVIGQQVGWLALATLVIRVVQARAARRLVVQGG